MAAPIISVRNLGKRYRLGETLAHDTLRDQLVHVARSLMAAVRKSNRNGNGAAGAAQDHIWALKEVGFEVEQGEVVGIIGRNGAGKSTLLKILSQITEPSVGEVRIRGRVRAASPASWRWERVFIRNSADGRMSSSTARFWE